MIQEEDVLTYALLPQVAEKFFQMRKNGTLEAVKEEQKNKQLLLSHLQNLHKRQQKATMTKMK